MENPTMFWERRIESLLILFLGREKGRHFCCKLLSYFVAVKRLRGFLVPLEGTLNTQLSLLDKRIDIAPTPSEWEASYTYLWIHTKVVKGII
jgi:hypothetical protein